MTLSLRSVPDVALNKASGKTASAYRTISEVSSETGVPAHILRSWEAKFPQLKPLKRGGGRRYYRPEDVALVAKIQKLLTEEGYTLRGVQKVLELQEASHMVSLPEPSATDFLRTRARIAGGGFHFESLALEDVPSSVDESVENLLRNLISELKSIRKVLEKP